MDSHFSSFSGTRMLQSRSSSAAYWGLAKDPALAPAVLQAKVDPNLIFLAAAAAAMDPVGVGVGVGVGEGVGRGVAVVRR